jgi:hypothetical protein
MSDRFKEATESVINSTGDAIADLLVQMQKGSWVDDHGHPVQNNAAMMNVAVALARLAAFRREFLGYSAPDRDHTVPAPAIPEPSPADFMQGPFPVSPERRLCRNRLRNEGKPYPKSGCAHCGNGGMAGCPYDGQRTRDAAI